MRQQRSHSATRRQREGGCWQAGKKTLSQNQSDHADLDPWLLASRLWENRCLLFKPPSLWYFVRVAWDQAPKWLRFSSANAYGRVVLPCPPREGENATWYVFPNETSIRGTFATCSESFLRRCALPYVLFLLSLKPAVLQMVKFLSAECLTEGNGEPGP